jgi:hypothetical protein
MIILELLVILFAIVALAIAFSGPPQCRNRHYRTRNFE